jgi:23S rRNA (adenine2503-C2)-methyltransferase
LEALLLRSPKQRSIMIAVTMMRGINSSPADAHALVAFLAPFKTQGVRVNVDLIPYNDIGMASLQRPTDTEIVAFKQVLWEAGVNHSVRLTRGEGEAAACGMLATKSRKARQTQPAPATSQQL